MKKTVFTLIVLLTLGTTTLFSQDNGLNPKCKVWIKNLEYNPKSKFIKPGIDRQVIIVSRDSIDIVKNNRHDDFVAKVDAAVKSGISNVYRLESVDSSAVGINYEISGKVTSITTSIKCKTKEEKDTKGKIKKIKYYMYSGYVGVVLNIRNLSTGVVTTQDFCTSNDKQGDYVSEDEVLSDCVYYLKNEISNFFCKKFPLTANIVASARENDKKTKVKELYIDLGTNVGLYKGCEFTVYRKGEILGRTTNIKIGTIEIKEVQGPEISLCKVLYGYGSKEIMEAFNEKAALVAIENGKH